MPSSYTDGSSQSYNEAPSFDVHVGAMSPPHGGHGSDRGAVAEGATTGMIAADGGTKKKRYKKLALVGVMLVVLAVIAIAVAVGVTQSNSGGTSDGDVTSVPADGSSATSVAGLPDSTAAAADSDAADSTATGATGGTTEELTERAFEVTPGPDGALPATVPLEAMAPALPPMQAVPPLSIAAGVVVPGADGKYLVCQNGTSQFWGDVDEKPCGVTTHINGTVELQEYFGGFDGFFSNDPSDGHEDCFNRAVTTMLGETPCLGETEKKQEWSDEEASHVTITRIKCEEPEDLSTCVCLGAIERWQRPWIGNDGVAAFLTNLRNTAAPIDFEYPTDQALADGGGRLNNRDKVARVMESMINVQNC